jgi:hypothetical protein
MGFRMGDNPMNTRLLDQFDRELEVEYLDKQSLLAKHAGIPATWAFDYP